MINKFQLSLATYIHDHKSEIKLKGTKRFSEKTGEYYLQNVLLKKIPEKGDQTNEMSFIHPLREASSLVNFMQKPNKIKSLKKKASEILTKLPDDSLTPIPTINKKEIKNKYEGKELSNAERTAVHIRRLEYSNCMKKKDKKSNSKRLLSIILIQQWWKVIYSIIKIQKNVRGHALRQKLMIELQNEEWLIERLLLFERNIHKVMLDRGLSSIYAALGIERRFKNEDCIDKISLLNKLFNQWKMKTIHLQSNSRTIIRQIIEYKLIGNSIKAQTGNMCIKKLHLGSTEMDQSLYSHKNKREMRENVLMDSYGKENIINIQQHITTINKRKDLEDDRYQFSNQLFTNSNKKIIILGLRDYFYKWIQNVQRKTEIKRIFSSLIYSQLSIGAKEGLTLRMTFSQLNKSSPEPKPMKCVNTSNYQTTMKMKWKENLTEGDKIDIVNVLNKNKEKYIYSKKTASFPSRREESKDNIENCSIQSTGLDKIAHRIEYDEMLYSKKEEEQNLNENRYLTAQDYRESLNMSSVKIEDKGIKTRENERELLLKTIIQRQWVKKCFTQLQPTQSQVSLSIINQIKSNSHKMNKFILLGMKKYYFDQWEFTINRSNIMNTIKSNEYIRKKCNKNKIKRLIGNIINNNIVRHNNNAFELFDCFNKWRIAAHRIIQYDLLALELQSVLSHHCQQYLLNCLRHCHSIKAELLKSHNSSLINYLQNNQFMRKQNMNSNDKSQDYSSKKIHYLKYANESNHKRHHSTQLNDEPYSFNRSLSSSQNNENKQNNNLFCYQLPVNSLKKIENINNDSFHLIKTKQEIFNPTIYSSQSFYLQKTKLENTLHKSANIHSNFVSLFDNPHPVIDDIYTQRIQVTKATIPLTKCKEEDKNDHLIKQKVINKCSKDISPQLESKTPLSPDHQYVLPIDTELRNQLNVRNDEDLKRIALLNYGQIYNLNSAVRQKRNKSDGIITNTLSLTQKNKRDNDRNANLIKQSKEKENIFSLQEVNFTQFYHSPIRNKRKNIQGDIDDQVGLYTNITKSSRRGKKPLFHNKRDSTDQINTDMSLFSIEKDNKELSFNVYETNNKAINCTKLNTMRPTPSISLYETEVGMTARQLLPPLSKECELNNNHKDLSHIFYRNNQDDNIYSTQSNFITNDNYQTSQIIIEVTLDKHNNFSEFDNISFSTNPNKRNSCPKSICFKKIDFKSNEEGNFPSNIKQTHCYSMLNNNIQFGNGIEPKKYFSFFFKSLLLKKLLTSGFLFRKNDNFLYLIKLTFHYKRVNQLFSCKELIANWRINLRTNKNGQNIDSFKRNKLIINKSSYIERPVFSRYQFLTENK